VHDYPGTFFFVNQLKSPSFSTVQNIYPTYHFPGIDFSKTEKLEETPTKPWWNRLGESHLKKIIHSRKPSSIKMLAS